MVSTRQNTSRKQKSTALDDHDGPSAMRSKAGASKPTKTITKESTPKPVESKRRLTLQDLKFDYDRSKRTGFPRHTRSQTRPRLSELDLERLNHPLLALMPQAPKNKRESNEDAKLQPAFSTKATYCWTKASHRSPAHDGARFKLDYDKAANAMRPRAYNKRAMASGMERRVGEMRMEQQEMFAGHETPPDLPKHDLVSHVKDRVSKDLGVPWHHFGPKHLGEWRAKGFERWNAEEWRRPTEENGKRMSFMMRGASYRKVLSET